MNIIVELKLGASIQAANAVQWVSQTSWESRILDHKSQNNKHSSKVLWYIFFPLLVLHFLVISYKEIGKQNLSCYLSDTMMHFQIANIFRVFLSCAILVHILDLYITFSLEVEDTFFWKLGMYREILKVSGWWHNRNVSILTQSTTYNNIGKHLTFEIFKSYEKMCFSPTEQSCKTWA